MLKDVLLSITLIIGIIAYIPYLKDVIFGNTKPHVYSWLIWAILNITFFSIQFNNNVGIVSFISLLTGIICTVIMLLGLGSGVRNITKTDGLFLLLALISAGLWIISKDALSSSILITLTNFFALLPTIRKSWFNPFEETLSTYIMTTTRTVLTLLLYDTYTIPTILPPVFGVTITILFCIMLIVRRKTFTNDIQSIV